MKTKFTLSIALCGLLFFSPLLWRGAGGEAFAQSVGISGTGAIPDASALLDIDATGMAAKGLLIPRVILTSLTDAGTIASPATSLLVYNTGASLSPAGYYYNSGTSGSPVWTQLLSTTSSGGWSTLGNTGTTASSAAIGSTVNNNFIGTTDAKDFVLASNNLERMRILQSNGYIGIATKTPTANLEISNIPGDGGLPGLRILGTNGGNYAASTIVLESNADWFHSSGIFYLNKAASNKIEWYAGVPYAAHGFGIGLRTGVTSHGGNSNNTADLSYNKFYIDTTGKVGIGTTAPASLFHSAGQIRTGIPSGGLGGAAATLGSMLFYNATNANTITIQSGTTSATHTLTLPTAQGAANTALTNDGSGNLTWAGSTTGTIDPTTTVEIMEDFVSNQGAAFSQAGTLGWSLGSGTFVTYPTSTLNNIGLISFGSGNTANAYKGYLYLNGGASGECCLGTQGNVTTISRMKNGQAANNDVLYRNGLFDDGVATSFGSFVAEPADGIYFRAVGTAKWEAVCRSGGTETAILSTVSQSTTFKQFKTVMNAAGTSVQFFIDGTSIGTIATNIPTVALAPAFVCNTATTTTYYSVIDYFYMKVTGLTR